MIKEFKKKLENRKSKAVNVKKKKVPKWLFPKNAERYYDGILYLLVKHTKESIKNIVLPKIPILIEQVKIKTPERNDSVVNSLALLMILSRNDIEKFLLWAISEVRPLFYQINHFNYLQFQKMNVAVSGNEFMSDEPWLDDQLALFADQNSKLITSMVESEQKRVAGIIERGLQQGSRFSSISKEIEKSFGITRRHATLIARDQTTKLNASLTRLRQEEVGVKEYIWSTANDERVRPTHKANEGKIFKWSKPSKITGHPGHDVNCRCVAIPVLDELI
jgi:SPP1 gp7 family putative phage head morphogenesis protein